MSETYLTKENEVKHTEENYVRVVPSVMGLLTLPDGSRVQRLSESHYLKKNLSRFSPIGGAEAVSLEGLTELSEAVDGLILYEIPRSHQQEGKPNLSETPYPNEHGSEYDLRVYIAESQMDNFYQWMNDTTLRQGVDGIIRECYEELALEARIEGYDPVLPELTSESIRANKIGVYTDVSVSTNPDRGAAGRVTHYVFTTYDLRLAAWAMAQLVDKVGKTPYIAAFTVAELQAILDGANEPIMWYDCPVKVSADILNMFDPTLVE